MNSKSSPSLARTPHGMPHKGGKLPSADRSMPRIKGSGVPHGGSSKAGPTLVSQRMGGVSYGGFKRGVI